MFAAFSSYQLIRPGDSIVAHLDPTGKKVSEVIRQPQVAAPLKAAPEIAEKLHAAVQKAEEAMETAGRVQKQYTALKQELEQLREDWEKQQSKASRQQPKPGSGGQSKNP